MKRSDYLENQWLPYPAMPENAVAAGRIYRLENEDETYKICLIRDQQKIDIKFDLKPALAEILQEGDLVAITAQRDVILLAPQRAALPKRTFDKDILSSWQKYVQGLRAFFFKKNFLEVKTPSLVVCPGTEPSLDVFSTELVVGSRRQKFYLPTSPELHLKKALSLGAENIFELAPCYRNGEITERHQPEFTMLEWYRAYSTLGPIKKDLIDLVFEMSHHLNVAEPIEVSTYSVAELFRIHCDFIFTPKTTMEELRALADRCGVDVRSAESIDDVFFLIFMEKIESQLPKNELVFVEKYPPYQAALARLTADGWGDRFEVYWKGYELANAFHELNDPHIQRLRAQEDLGKKTESHKEVVALDEEFFQALEAGMPPSGGIALGVERLFMALKDISQIQDLRVFPH